MAGGNRRQGQPKSQDASSTGARPDLADRVLRYFHQNKDAMDSVEGISRFWVHEQRGPVERCLVDLYRQGLLQKRTIAGTDFYSLHKGSPHPESALTQRGAATAASHAEARGRVLVVDDDPAVLELLVDILSKFGYSVAGAKDGHGAIETFHADPFDVVVTDVLMPGISGIKVLEAVKEHRPSTEVIVLTGHASLETAIKALRHGAYDFITKPLDDIETLPRVVGRALERQRLSTENRLLVEKVQTRNLELRETVTRLAAVNEVGRAMTALLDLDRLYDTVVRLMAQHLTVRRVSVLALEPDSATMSMVASVGITAQEALKKKVRVGEGIAGRVAASQSPLLVSDIEKSEVKGLRSGGRYVTNSFMVAPLMASSPVRHQQRLLGVINVSDKHSGDLFTEQNLEFLSTLACQVAVAVENAHLVKEMEGRYLDSIAALIQAAEDAWPQTRGHSRRVVELAVAVAREVGLEEVRVALLHQAAALHNVGRVLVRSKKGGRMKAGKDAIEEWGAAYVIAAKRVLAPITSLGTAREIILRSADRFDAAPAPYWTDHPAIPIESRILGICEEFVRLTRAGGRDPEQTRRALQAIQGRASKKYDPEVVAALNRALEKQTPP